MKLNQDDKLLINDEEKKMNEKGIHVHDDLDEEEDKYKSRPKESKPLDEHY
jgi:hypothetical protein